MLDAYLERANTGARLAAGSCFGERPIVKPLLSLHVRSGSGLKGLPHGWVAEPL